MAVQLCKHLGAEVAGTCSERNRDHVAALGCDRIIPYDKVAFESAVSAQDVVIDLVGGEVHTRSYGVLRPGGMLVWLIAQPFEDRSAGLDIEVRQAMIVDNPRILNAVVNLASAGRLRPLVSRACRSTGRPKPTAFSRPAGTAAAGWCWTRSASRPDRALAGCGGRRGSGT